MGNYYEYGEPIIEGIDIAKGISRFAGKKERYLKNLRKFVERLDSSIMPFDSFLSSEETATACEKLHTAKGVAGNLEMIFLFNAIKAFETSVREGSPDKSLYDDMKNIAASVKSETLEKTEGFDTDSDARR